MAGKSSYTPSDRVNSLAKVGESITFEVTATNDGNVDVHNVTLSNQLFKNGAGEQYTVQTTSAMHYLRVASFFRYDVARDIDTGMCAMPRVTWFGHSRCRTLFVAHSYHQRRLRP